MRAVGNQGASNVLYVLHQDHLGSTSLVTSITGTVVSQQWYYPYGETRAISGTVPTTLGFTGQRRDEGVGSLMFYQARHYSPLLSRFVSADTMVPEAGNPQALNRYAYVVNRPLVLIDPSGRTYLCDEECDAGNWKPGLAAFGINTTGLTALEVLAIAAAAEDIGAAFLAANPTLGTVVDAFRAVYGLASNTFSFKRCPPGACTALGLTVSSTEVWFNPFVYSRGAYPSTWWERTVHLVVHEFGHAFNGRVSSVVDEDYYLYNALARTQASDPTFPDRVDNDSALKGFAGPPYNWQQSRRGTAAEEFADMFLGWTYDKWETTAGGLSPAGQARADWMAARMPLWVDMAVGR